MIRFSILFLFFLVYACSRKDDGLPIDPCYNNPIYNTYKSKNLGLLAFGDSSAQWVFYDTLQSISFVNSNNYRANLAYSHTATSHSEQQFNFRDSVGALPCKFIYRINDYGYVQKQTVHYKGQNLGLTFSYCRNNKIDSSSSDSLHLLYGTDFFSLVISNVEFKFPFNYKTALPTCILHDTLTLGTKTYKNVYESYFNPTTIDTNNVTVTGAYYTINNGLIGFYLSNKERWYRD